MRTQTEDLLDAINESIAAISCLKEPISLQRITQAADLLVDCFATGHKVLIAGNGGSLCQATHFAEELTGQFRLPRPPLPAIALTESGQITCIANDFGFDQVFSRAVEALGKPHDVLLVLSTSGNSPNILRAVQAAREGGLRVIAFLGKGGGACRTLADVEWIVEGPTTSDRIQEAHMAALHLVVERVEKTLFPSETMRSYLS